MNYFFKYTFIYYTVLRYNNIIIKMCLNAVEEIVMCSFEFKIKKYFEK